jgi:hypothetical protein
MIIIAMNLQFAEHIRPLFRENDRAEMEWAFDLWSYQHVRAAADVILERLNDGDMPCDQPWPADRIELFRSWISAGFPT